MADTKQAPGPGGWAGDLFDEGLEVSQEAAPLDPGEFARREQGMPPAAWTATAQPPRAVHWSDDEDSDSDVPTVRALDGLPEDLDLGLPLGSGPASVGGTREIGSGTGILGLPLAPAVTPKLPCTVLMVGSDRVAAAMSAAALVASGYTCRVVPPEEASAVLAVEPVDVVLVDLPPELARAADPAAISRAFGGYSGPVVLMSAGLLPPVHERGWRTLTKPAPEPELIAAVEAVRAERAPVATEVPAAAAVIPTPPRPPSFGDGGPQLFELTDNLIRGLLITPQGSSRRGRIRSMSHVGHVVVEIRDPLPVGVEVEVEVVPVDGQRGLFRGKVSRRSADQMMLELRMDTAQAALLVRFVEEARDIAHPNIEQVRIRELPRAVAAPVVDVVDDRALAVMFERAAQDLDDDGLQQAFIQACIKAQRLEFAVSCYRDLKARLPDDARVARYLQQVGTILGFYAFRNKEVEGPEGGMPKTVKWALVIFVVASLALWVTVALLS